MPRHIFQAIYANKLMIFLKCFIIAELLYQQRGGKPPRQLGGLKNGLWYFAEQNNADLAERYFDELVNNPNRANEFLSDEYLQEKGFEKVHEYHTCGYYRDNDNINPASVLEREQKRGYDVIFQLCSSNPFETEYTLWKRKVVK